MKVTHQLGLQGWIETVRGKGRSMRLSRLTQDVYLGELMRDVEPNFRLVAPLRESGPVVSLIVWEPVRIVVLDRSGILGYPAAIVSVNIRADCG